MPTSSMFGREISDSPARLLLVRDFQPIRLARHPLVSAYLLQHPGGSH